MTLTFAYSTRVLQACAFVGVLFLTACATRLPPTMEVAAAQQSLARATAADADQYALGEVERARALLGQAQAALSAGRDDEARGAALSSAALADLALARSREATAQSELAQHRAQISDLRSRIGVEGE